MLTLRLADTADLEIYWDHLQRHDRESGRDGDLIFSPFAGPKGLTFEEFCEYKMECWPKNLDEPGWERTWLLTDERSAYGALTLTQSPALETSLHRATLSIGIERPYRGQGLGDKFMKTAVTWAQLQTELVWLQLYVFEHNTPARALYKKHGFFEVGTTPDLFRHSGVKINDVSMVLNLG